MGLWTIWSSGRWPCPWQRVGTRRALGPFQPTPFYNFVILNSKTSMQYSQPCRAWNTATIFLGLLRGQQRLPFESSQNSQTNPGNSWSQFKVSTGFEETLAETGMNSCTISITSHWGGNPVLRCQSGRGLVNLGVSWNGRWGCLMSVVSRSKLLHGQQVPVVWICL